MRTHCTSLSRLQNGEIPNYDDEWLALLYSTWYQLSHTDLAYSIIKATAKQRSRKTALLTRKGKVLVVDFGCGTLAMQFGVVLAAADALHQGQPLTSIRIDLIDSSQSMIDFGLKIWKQFKKEAGRNEQLASLSEACDLVSIETLAAGEDPTIDPKYSRWMSAMHVLYNENREDVKKELYRLSNAITAHVGFITYHSSSYALAKSVSPFNSEGYELLSPDVQLLLKQPDSFSNPKIWNVRYDLCDQIDRYVEDDWFVRNYLSGNIPWKPSRANWLIYTKR